MRNVISAISLLCSLATAGSIEQASCMPYADFTTWDMRSSAAVKKNGEYQYYNYNTLTWNLCSYIKFSDTPHEDQVKQQGIQKSKTFAYKVMNGTVYTLTEGFLPDFESTMDDAGEINGITYTFQSDTQCPYNKTETFTFQNTLMCNKNITEAGGARILSVVGENSCHPHVTMEHEDGCTEYSFKGFVKFLDDNAWLSGTILVVLGAAMCFVGKMFFKWVMALLAAIVGFGAVMYITSLFGWLSATWSLVVFIILAAVAGIALGYLMFAMIPLSIGLLGVVAGFFGGAALYSLILGLTGYDAVWLLITLCVVGAIVMGFLSFKMNNSFLIFGTAFVGGYMFMRGTTFWFGHYPSEMEMFSMMTHGQDIQLEWQFWVYFATFIVMTLAGTIVQSKIFNKTDTDADNYYKTYSKA